MDSDKELTVWVDKMVQQVKILKKESTKAFYFRALLTNKDRILRQQHNLHIQRSFRDVYQNQLIMANYGW